MSPLFLLCSPLIFDNFVAVLTLAPVVGCCFSFHVFPIHPLLLQILVSVKVRFIVWFRVKFRFIFVFLLQRQAHEWDVR
jgi:hypothetical protein